MTTNTRVFLASIISFILLVSGALAEQPTNVSSAPAAQVSRIKVQPDLAPDCSSLKAIVESVTRGCENNDAKAIAIYNFMLLSHYHCPYAREDGGIPAIKEINVYGWGVCGGTHSVMSALWRQLGWNWRFIGWPGHTTVEAEYDGRWHYLDAFLKIYAWMPDGKGGQTIASEYDLKKNAKALLQDAFVFDKARRVTYMKGDEFVMRDGKANWRAHDFLSCGGTLTSLPALRRVGPAKSWAGYNHADGDYNTDVNLGPGFTLTNTWDAFPNAWYWKGSKKPPSHSCPNYKDTRNSAGLGLVLEPYINAKPARSWGNGLLTFIPDFSTDACLNSFLSAENIQCADEALVPIDTNKPAVLVVLLASPYVMTKATGEAAGADKVEISVDDGRTFKAIDLKNFDDVIKGKLAVQIKLTFSEPLTALKLEMTVQNSPGALPYLSPGKNIVTVSVADPAALGNNKLVVTYAYRLGARSLSFEQLCKQNKRIANQSGAKWSNRVTYIQKTYTAGNLPATFEIDCPTPKGQYRVYPRMMFVRREVLSPMQQPMPLPPGAVAAKSAAAWELETLPNPLLLGIEPPPLAKTVATAAAMPSINTK